MKVSQELSISFWLRKDNKNPAGTWGRSRHTGNLYYSQCIESTVFKTVQRSVYLLVELYAQYKKQRFSAVSYYINGQVHNLSKTVPLKLI
jgi:hypothetical protein